MFPKRFFILAMIIVIFPLHWVLFEVRRGGDGDGSEFTSPTVCYLFDKQARIGAIYKLALGEFKSPRSQ